MLKKNDTHSVYAALTTQLVINYKWFLLEFIHCRRVHHNISLRMYILVSAYSAQLCAKTESYYKRAGARAQWVYRFVSHNMLVSSVWQQSSRSSTLTVTDAVRCSQRTHT